MNREDIFLLIFLAIFIIFFPVLTGGSYILTIAIFTGINSLVAIGVVILMGYGGQVSLGQAGFYGIGAYVSAILSLMYGLPVVLSILIAIFISALSAILLAIPALRLKGHYLAVATLGFGEIVYIVLNEWGPGGPSGFGEIPNMNLFGYVINSPVEYFYLVWTIVIAVMIFSINLTNSLTGKALKAMHDSEIASVCIGINITELKVKLFILSAVYASLAGALYAHYVTFLSPSGFSLFYSVLVLMMVIIGGMNNLWGGIVGATVITVLPEILRGFKELDIVIYGFVLIIFLLFMRQGIMPLLLSIFRKNA